MGNPRTRMRDATDALCADRQVPAVTIEEVGQIEREHGNIRDGDAWGPWAWDANAGTLDYTGGAYARCPYSVPVRRKILESEDAPAAAWEWVRHIARKRWPAPAIRCFVLAILEILRQKGGPLQPEEE